ncbi:MAG: DUF3098 domain-containing protein [Paramuribaculum sp.]|nr:DUF3098 domain-containing protein [Paramuribaculum sp.]MDE6459942.1 DUF3098 domain-containing protein [Paramuribaculum sp.]MDE6652242.1 DUF3098 domain-containing protein [Paramuribaculum sp.]
MANNNAQNNIESRLDTESKQQQPLQRINFILMAIAAGMIILGFLLMTGAPATAQEFNPDIFSTRRIVVGPTITFLGFVFMAVAIAWNSKSKK